jgi:flagellar motor switch protein FliM
MAEVLSQSEIDALLAAVSSGGVDTEPKQEQTSTDDWIAYDLVSQEKVGRGRLGALHGIFERFCQSFRATLSGLLKKDVSVTLESIEFMHFGDHLSTVMLPTALNILSLQNLKSHCILQVGSKLTYALVDAYYGGAERPYSKIGGRDEFTPVEGLMIQKFCSLVIPNLVEAWRPNYYTPVEYVRMEANPNFLGVIHAQDNVVLVTVDVEFENLSGSMVFVYPLRPLERVAQALSVNVVFFGDEEKELWYSHWLTEVMRTEFDIRVELGYAMRPLGGLKHLKKGEILLLNQDATGELEVLVQGLAKYTGLMGTAHGNAAVRITEVLEAQRKVSVEHGKS